MDIFTKVAKNTFTQVFGRVVVVLLTVAVTTILTRLLGLVGYGNYVFIITLVLFFNSIADWGTALISIREVAKNKSEEERFFGNAFLARSLLAILSVFLMNIFIYGLSQFRPLASTLWLVSLLLLLISLKTSTHIVFQTRQKFEYMALIDVVISGIFLVFLLGTSLVFTTLPADLTTIIFFFLLANFSGTALAVYFSTRLTKFDFHPNMTVVKKILFEAVPTGALLLVFAVYNRLDIFLLQLLKGSESVGIYGLAYKIHDNLVLGAAYLMAALFPPLSKLVSEGDLSEKLPLVYRKTFDVLLLGGLLVVGGVLVLAPAIIFIIGGSEFSASALALRILVFATFLSYFNHLTGYTLIALGKQKISLVVALMALVWNLVLNILLIPRYSFVGAAVVTIATEGLVLVLTSFYLAKKFQLRPGLTFLQTSIEIIKKRGRIF